MKIDGLTSFSMPPLPPEAEVTTHRDGDEAEWESIIESAFGSHFDFSFLKGAVQYDPGFVYYISVGHRKIATVTATHNPAYPGNGWLSMVGVHRDFAGRGYGKALVMIALDALKRRGYPSAMLSTDDDRIPALCTYLSSGFVPFISHESHPRRWRDLAAKLPERFAPAILSSLG
ncbi:MAG: GNAT family N-acetyltransferase [Clostridia bacterium]|nr:GNAT family N-acetyltransferase [Clostridia bacterium]